MKSVVLAIALAGCVPDADPYSAVIPSSNPPALAQAHENPNTPPDAGRDAGTTDATPARDAGGFGFDALPTAFDAGAPTDVGSPPADAGVPPNP